MPYHARKHLVHHGELGPKTLPIDVGVLTSEMRTKESGILTPVLSDAGACAIDAKRPGSELLQGDIDRAAASAHAGEQSSPLLVEHMGGTGKHVSAVSPQGCVGSA